MDIAPVPVESRLRIVLLGQPQIQCLSPQGNLLRSYPFPRGDNGLLLAYLIYRRAQQVENVGVDNDELLKMWRRVRGKNRADLPNYEGSIRNAIMYLRRELAKCCGHDIKEDTKAGLDFLAKSGVKRIALTERVSSDWEGFLTALKKARDAAREPANPPEVLRYLQIAQKIAGDGAFLPEYQEFGEGDEPENGNVANSEVYKYWYKKACLQWENNHRFIGEAHARFKETGSHSSPFANLPLPLDGFVERDDLMRTVVQWLRCEGPYGRTPLLLLHGDGGSGKTRLAIESVRSLSPSEAEERFPGKLYFLPLDKTFQNPAQVQHERLLDLIAVAVNAPDAVQKALPTEGISVLQTWLSRQPHRLLISDNWESVGSPVANALLTELIRGSDNRLRCLLTSRATVDGATHLPVGGLELPPSATAAHFDEYPACRLYLNRVWERDPSYSIPDYDALFAILETTGGLPLAIELTTMRVWDKGAKGLQEVATSLHERKRLTALDVPDPPHGKERSLITQFARHMGMEDCIAWTFDLLPPDEQVLFVRLGIFPYDFSADAAQVIGDISLSLLRKWRDLCLLASDRDRERWLFRPLIREFAEKLFMQASEYDTIRIRHRNYFLEVARQQNEIFCTKDYNGPRTVFEQEAANIEVAFSYSVHHQTSADAQAALQFAFYQYEYLKMLGRLNTIFLLATQAVGHTLAKTQLLDYANALTVLTNIAYRVRKLVDFRAYQAELEALAIKHNIEEPDIILALGNAFTSNDKYLLAEQKLLHAFHLYKQSGSLLGMMMTANSLGVLYAVGQWNKIEKSIYWLQLAAETSEMAYTPDGGALGWSNLATATVSVDNALAYKAARKSIQASHKTRFLLRLSWGMNSLGMQQKEAGNMVEALQVMVAADQMREQLYYEPNEVMNGYIREIRSLLSPETYDHAVATAEAWTTDEAVEYALSLPLTHK